MDFKETTIILISTPIYVVFIGAEILISAYFKHRKYSVFGTIENFYLMFLNMGLDILMRAFTLYVLGFFYSFKLFIIENQLLYWFILLILEDFMFYWLHYFDHYVRFFWAIHVTHHSSQEFNLTVGFRSSVFQPLYRFIYFIPIAFLGFEPLDIMLMYSITQIYGILIHTQYIGKLGWLEYVFATPSNHRVHHGSNVKYLDKNMGMVFIIWDRIFGTYQEEEEEVVYGLTKNIPDHKPSTVVLHEWKSMWNDVRNAPDIKSKLGYIFGPPGWSHDGSRKTSEQLRKEQILALKIKDQKA
jgi:sterol desaturase/sphingolipid hydroxylase (fatty acid hydroxylase superfamily)